MVIENGHFDKKNQYIEEVAAYIRVSTQEQKIHGLSLNAQVEKLTEYAEAHDLKIVGWYKDEGVSGRKLIKKRPELQRMIKDAQKGRFKRIIFIKLDRYFRSVAEFHECQKILDEANVTWTATEEKYDMSTANGRAFVNMKLTIAELEADQTGERIRLVNEYKVKAGMPLFGSNNMPFCYAVGEPKQGEEHKYIVKRDEDIMEDLISHVMTNQSIHGAVVYINRKYNRKFHYNAISTALKNEMICGSYRGNPNYCKPYISREQFDLLQEIIKRNPRDASNDHAYLFTGLIRCPKCGARMTGTMHVTKVKGNRYQYYNYRCYNNRTHRICDYSSSVFEASLEKMMLDKVEEFVVKKKLASIESRNNQDKVKKYDLEELQGELNRLNYAWKKGRITSVEQYDKDYDDLMAKINEATNEIATQDDEPDYEAVQGILCEGWKGIYKDLDDVHKRAFWRSFIQEIRFGGEGKKKYIEDILFL